MSGSAGKRWGAEGHAAVRISWLKAADVGGFDLKVAAGQPGGMDKANPPSAVARAPACHAARRPVSTVAMTDGGVASFRSTLSIIRCRRLTLHARRQ